MKSVFKVIGAIAAFWAIVFLGPAVVMLLNNIGYLVSGSGYGPDSLMYIVLQFLKQPISCFFAYLFAKEICGEDHPVCPLANCIIAACMCVLFALIASSGAQMATMFVSAAAMVVCAVIEAKELAKTNNRQEEEPQEVTELKNKIADFEKTLKEHDSAYIENKKILAEAYSEEELKQMVNMGEISHAQADEYIRQRESLALWIACAPAIRAKHTNMINELKEQLSQLQRHQ